MKRFLKKTMLFLFVFISGLIIVILSLTALNKKLFDKYPTGHVNTILIGDSHMEMGMNDKLFPGSLNLAKSSDGYIHSYAKLRAFLEKENGITTVILSYSAHNLSSYFDTFIDGRDARFGFSDYFPIFFREEMLELLKRNKLLGIHSLSLVLKRGFANLFADSNRYSFLGGYSPQPWRLTDYSNMDKRIRIQFYDGAQLRPFSDIQLHYLQKIVDLCSDHRVKLVLIEMPLHEYYMKQIPTKYDSAVKTVVQDKSILWMNCRQLNLPDSLFLPDGDHVNITGADTTTKYIYGRLNNTMY